MCVCVCAPPMILCKSMGSRGVEDKEKRGLRSHLWKLVVGGGHLHILMQLGGERETDSFFFFFFSSPLSLFNMHNGLFPLFRPFLLLRPQPLSALSSLLDTFIRISGIFAPLFRKEEKSQAGGPQDVRVEGVAMDVFIWQSPLYNMAALQPFSTGPRVASIREREGAAGPAHTLQIRNNHQQNRLHKLKKSSPSRPAYISL